MSKNNKPYHNYNNYSTNNTNKVTVDPTEVVANKELEAVTKTSSAAGFKNDASPVIEAEISAEEFMAESIVTAGCYVEDDLLVDEDDVTKKSVIETTEFITGVVNCAKLRIRSTPDSTVDNIVCEIKSGSEVQINEVESTIEFYKVVTSAGVEGFCMKKFITIK